MSAILCHYFHGQRLLSHQDILAGQQKNAFVLGLQGPAIFAYSFLFSKEGTKAQKALCETLASISPEMLARFAAEASQRGNAVTDAYCRGVCCYCVLEQQTSPFVQYSAEMIHRIEENKSVADSKNQVESALDIILLRYETAKLPTEFDLRTTVPLDEPLCKTIALFYAAICRELGHSEWSADEIGPLFEDGCKAIGKLNDRTLMKRQFLKRREKRQGKSGGVSSLMRNISEDEDYDYANVCEQEWQWPMESGDIRTDTYFALYESAVQKAEQRLAHWNPIMNG